MYKHTCESDALSLFGILKTSESLRLSASQPCQKADMNPT